MVGVAVVPAAQNRSIRVEDHPLCESERGHADAHEDTGSAVVDVTMVTTCDEQLLHARLVRLTTPMDSPDPIRGRGTCSGSGAAAAAAILPGRMHPSRPG